MTNFARAGVRSACRGLILGMVFAFAADMAGAAAAGFLPHRAVYDLSLGKSRGDGAVAQAKGKLEFEWDDVCSGWTVNQRTRVQLISAEGQVLEFGWTLSSLESRDGRDYRFFIRRFNADGSREAVRGRAHLDGKGGAGVAIFEEEPKPREVPLAKGTLFPTAHSLLLMDAARTGDLPLWRLVFDGSGTDGRFGVNAALSRALSAEAPRRFESPLLQTQDSWRLNLAYFGMDDTVAEPEHEQTLRLYANGVVDEMLLDYGDFVLKADLGTLEALPELECEAE